MCEACGGVPAGGPPLACPPRAGARGGSRRSEVLPEKLLGGLSGGGEDGGRDKMGCSPSPAPRRARYRIEGRVSGPRPRIPPKSRPPHGRSRGRECSTATLRNFIESGYCEEIGRDSGFESRRDRKISIQLTLLQNHAEQTVLFRVEFTFDMTQFRLGSRGLMDKARPSGRFFFCRARPSPPPARPPEHLKDQFAADAYGFSLSFLREKFLIVPLSGWAFCVPRYWRTEEDVSNHLDNPGQHRPT